MGDDHSSTEDAAERLKVQLRKDLTAAMQARSSREIAVLRALIAALDNAQAVNVPQGHVRYVVRAFGDPKGEVPRQRLEASDVDALLEKEVIERIKAAEQFAEHGRTDRASALRAEAEIVARYRSAVEAARAK